MPPKKRSIATPASSPRTSISHSDSQGARRTISSKAGSSYDSLRSLLGSKTEDLPGSLAKFPALLLFSLAISAALHSFTARFLAGDLAEISRSGPSWGETVAWIGLRGGELLVGWLLGFDGLDLAALTFVSHYPKYFLFNQFYLIRPSTVIANMAIDVLASSVPFSLLRTTIPAHTGHPPPGSIANSFIINDLPVQLALGALAAALHGLVLFASYQTWLPSFLVVELEGMPSVAAAKQSQFSVLVAALLPLGIATRALLFTPAAATQTDDRDRAVPEFDPASATLSETVAYTFWSWSARTRELIKRAATTATLTLVYTFLHLHFTVHGIESLGAAAWASVWAFALLATAAVFVWVGQFEKR